MTTDQCLFGVFLGQELTELLNALGPDMFTSEAWP